MNQIVKKAQEQDINPVDALIFSIVKEVSKTYPEVLDKVVNEGIKFSYEDYQQLEMSLGDTPFNTVNSGTIEEFYNLLSSFGVTSAGFINNPLSFYIFDRKEDSKVINQIDKSEWPTIARKLKEYYANTTYCTTLAKAINKI